MSSCNSPCHHYLSIKTICPNHSDHSNLVVSFPGTPRAFIEAVSTGTVATIQVSTKRDSVCSLNFVAPIDETSILASDSSNQEFIIPLSTVISFT